jgi:hypothetical protein
MRRILGFVMLAFIPLAFGSSACNSTAADGDKDKSKGVVVDFDGLKSKTPGDWKEEEPAKSSFVKRYKQFRLPKRGDDKEDAELVIFQGVGGESKANIERWKGQFTPPEGKKSEDVTKVTEIRIGDRPATYLDVQGTFTPPPFSARGKVEKKANYRMLGVHFDGPRNVYHIKLTGPAKTVEAYKKEFDEWVKNFK